MVDVTVTDSSEESQFHKILLIRHGETVDNVAGLYAGIRDSALTTHGAQQISRLGTGLARNGHKFSHIYSSDLSRAYKTAEAIRAAQPVQNDAELVSIEVSKDLREQDFGYYEGKPFGTRNKEPTVGFKQVHSENETDLSTSQPSESRESVMKRAERFLNTQLFPALQKSEKSFQDVAVVSHGMLLSALWRSILKIQRPKTIDFEPELLNGRLFNSLEHLGGWSNTGYLELHLTPLNLIQPSEDPKKSADEGIDEVASMKRQSDFSVTIRAINNTKHLQGLKRTRGGVGSSKYEEGQKSIDSFFKKRKTG